MLGEDTAKPTDTPAAVQDRVGIDASSDEELEYSMPEPAILDTRVSPSWDSMRGRAILGHLAENENQV